MLDQTNADSQANADADKTAEMDEDIDLETLDEESDVEKLRKQLRTTVEQKKHFRDKVKTYEADPRLKEAPKKAEETPKPKSGSQEDLEARIEDQVMTRNKFPDMTDEEVTRAKSLAKSEGKRFSEVVSDGYFQAYMKTNRENLAKEKARPSPSNRSGNPTGFTINDLQDVEKMRQMDNETFERLSNEAAKQKKNNVIRS